MHMQGTPATMQQSPRYGDVTAEVRDYLRSRADAALAAGIERDRILIDPGIGFGKNVSHNLQLLRDLFWSRISLTLIYRVFLFLFLEFF